MEANVFTVDEVAQYLRTEPTTVGHLLASGELAGFRVEGEWKVLGAALLDFLKRRMKESQLQALGWGLSDPKAWAREARKNQELLRMIESQDFKGETFGQFLKDGLAALEEEEMPDYLHEDTLRLEKRLEGLKRARTLAEQEAQHARSQPWDLEGPIKAAEAAVQRLSAQISDVERLVERVKAGYPYLDRRGFELAVYATGEVCTWTVLSEIPVPGTILGHADADVRLPVEVQKLYAQAKSTQLFQRFEVCKCFEPPDDVHEQPPENVLTHYLFGTVEEGSAIFLIAKW